MLVVAAESGTFATGRGHISSWKLVVVGMDYSFHLYCTHKGADRVNRLPSTLLADKNALGAAISA